jgi:restriction endonuclease S subunit
VFSWEGAIAVAKDADEGRVGSHRFITCVPDPALATAEFLRSWLLTDEGMSYILEASPGAAGRNRTLGLKKLVAIPVPLPPLDAQQRLTRLSGHLADARQTQVNVAEELKSMLPAVLDLAFRGEL